MQRESKGSPGHRGGAAYAGCRKRLCSFSAAGAFSHSTQWGLLAVLLCASALPERQLTLQLQPYPVTLRSKMYKKERNGSFCSESCSATDYGRPRLVAPDFLGPSGSASGALCGAALEQLTTDVRGPSARWWPLAFVLDVASLCVLRTRVVKLGVSVVTLLTRRKRWFFCWFVNFLMRKGQPGVRIVISSKSLFGQQIPLLNILFLSQEPPVP